MSHASTATQVRQKFKTPSMWRVVLYNDDFTPMDFVEQVLQVLFNKSKSEATELMLRIHNSGKAQIGLYTKEIAQSKVRDVEAVAAQHGHPLLAKAEEA